MDVKDGAGLGAGLPPPAAVAVSIAPFEPERRCLPLRFVSDLPAPAEASIDMALRRTGRPAFASGLMSHQELFPGPSFGMRIKRE